MLPQIETIPPAGDAAHILLVEDDDGLRMLVTRLLRESGYRVTGCRTGAEFWRLLPAGGVDLVLLDVMLPGALRPRPAPGVAGEKHGTGDHGQRPQRGSRPRARA